MTPGNDTLILLVNILEKTALKNPEGLKFQIPPLRLLINTIRISPSFLISMRLLLNGVMLSSKGVMVSSAGRVLRFNCRQETSVGDGIKNKGIGREKCTTRVIILRLYLLRNIGMNLCCLLFRYVLITHQRKEKLFCFRTMYGNIAQQ